MTSDLDFVALGHARPGLKGVIQCIKTEGGWGGIDQEELEQRLLELGFVEGAPIEVLHEGLFGRDPMAVRVHNVTVALRRREAMAILVTETAIR
ncbi:MAG: ferrous iron transport protein A [Hyphomicrobiaceae bacterium]